MSRYFIYNDKIILGPCVVRGPGGIVGDTLAPIREGEPGYEQGRKVAESLPPEWRKSWEEHLSGERSP